ncbi:MAG: hypothetical protein KAH46_02215, partial [Mycobacterium sp.]|nr:hypothetical protein [Mycobacterium sp.]
RRARAAGKISGNPQAPWLARLLRRLELQYAVSQARRHEPADATCSNHEEFVGTREAATLLGWTTRQVQRRQTDLDGRKLASGQLVFPANAVREYAEGLNDARTVA